MAKGRGRTGARNQAKGPGARQSKVSAQDDIPMDDVDRFDAARDKILLDDAQYEPDAEEDDFGANDREVLGFGKDRYEDDEEDEDEEDEDEEEDEDDEEDDEGELNDDDERYRTMHIPEPIARAANRRAPRDDAKESDDENDDEESEEEDLGWGANKRSYYSGNTAEDLESDSEIDEDKAHELETNEAIRLQRQSRAGMNDDEFGLENIDAVEAQMNADEQSAAARAKRKRELDGVANMPTAASIETSPEELVAKLQIRAPIVLALVDEFGGVLKQLRETQEYVAHVSEHGERQVAEIAHLYYQTLSSYTMLLAFFFQLASVPEMAAEPERLLTHPVMERLSQFKKALVEMKALGLFDPEDLGDEDEREMAGIMGPPTDEDLEYEQLGDLESGELDDLIEDEKENQHVYEQRPASPQPKPAKRRKSKKAAEAPAPEPAPLAAVAAVGAAVPRPKRSTPKESLESADAYGEPTQMRKSDAQEKAQRKRDVKFHADASVDVNGPVKANKLEGDADIPYRDRQRSRDAVAAAKSSKAAKAKALSQDTSLNDTEWGEGDWRDRQAVMGGERSAAKEAEDDDAAYYDLISSNKRAKKSNKKQEYDEQRLASRVYDDEELAPGEHRLIDRTIEKNKGLTPHRPKSVRNPRVKRRMKFDKANKRLSSTRAVYKGGQNALQGGYQGEKSGISTHLVKSRKLGS
ncbi:something about silencing protein 10 [Malassezia japonica]|uniref:Something about silencing protein 10 n=1 Tax=Malassezia japonica TaxID=223818 RepID=A0AAF0JA94_9BASI|nr:something about silencing protein 10 [Malassezia japonica]WFD38519.1 something about silencing protein 10 [Malassezia japonica]